MKTVSPETKRMRDEYRNRNLTCEYCPYFGTKQSWHPRGNELELDHIWGRRGPCECRTNYAMACPYCHDRKTSGDMVIEGRVAMIHRKLAKGEFCREGMKACAGKDPIGWVESVMDRLTGDWIYIAQEILDMVESHG